jgi:hypothetical protein
VGRERAVRAGVTPRDIEPGVRHWGDERFRQTCRERHAECVPIAGGVLDGHPPCLTHNLHGHGPPVAHERLDGAGRVDAAARGHLLEGEIAEREQQIVNPVDAARRVRRVATLQLRLHLVDRIGVQQLAQLRLAEQLPQLALIDGERLCPPLGERRITIVDVVGDVPEQE